MAVGHPPNLGADPIHFLWQLRHNTAEAVWRKLPARMQQNQLVALREENRGVRCTICAHRVPYVRIACHFGKRSPARNREGRSGDDAKRAWHNACVETQRIGSSLVLSGFNEGPGR
jgi:hypothetical protein